MTYYTNSFFLQLFSL